MVPSKDGGRLGLAQGQLLDPVVLFGNRAEVPLGSGLQVEEQRYELHLLRGTQRTLREGRVVNGRHANLEGVVSPVVPVVLQVDVGVAVEDQLQVFSIARLLVYVVLRNAGDDVRNEVVSANPMFAYSLR